MCIICQECNRRNGTHFQLDITPFIEMLNLLWFFWIISSGFFSYSKLFPSTKNEEKRIKKRKIQGK
jgi:hypothetical protein